MEYIVENGLNIMFLCIGLGFLLMSIRVAGLIGNTTKLVKKVHRITDMIEIAIERPMRLFMTAQNIVGRILKMFF